MAKLTDRAKGVDWILEMLDRTANLIDRHGINVPNLQ